MMQKTTVMTAAAVDDTDGDEERCHLSPDVVLSDRPQDEDNECDDDVLRQKRDAKIIL